MSLVLADVQPTENPKITEITVLKEFKGMTNGEVMKAVFESDNVQFDETGSWIHIIINGMDYSFCPVEFWNAPYKAESEVKDGRN